MYIFLQKIKSFIILLALMVGVAFVADAQSSESEYQIMMNKSLSILMPGAFPPEVFPNGQPQNGSLVKEKIDGSWYIIYTPAQDWKGTDEFTAKITLFSNTGQQEAVFLKYSVEVVGSIVRTNRDFISTLVNTNVILSPLENDESSSGNLNLKPIAPIYNDGYVEIIGDDLIYYPANNFKGITHIGYIACDDEGTCEKGKISVLVHDYVPPVSTETGSVLTAQDQSIPVLIPYYGFEIDQQPANGKLVPAGDFVFIYTPDNGFSGMDNFSFVYAGADPKYYEVEAIVMEVTPSNNFAIDDYVYTPVGKPIDIDVDANDLGNTVNWSIQVTELPLHGAAWPNHDPFTGEIGVLYTPDPDFEGTDRISYRIMNPFGTYEEATIYVTTSNFFPAQPSFSFTTVEGGSVSLSYTVPLVGYTLENIGSPSNGVVVINGDVIEYIPDEDFTGNDNFEIRYCVDDNCYDFVVRVDVQPSEHNIEPCKGLDCVWAGDANRDGIVNGRDALMMTAIGEVGKTRPNANVDWVAQDAPDWGESISGINSDIKFVDTDGDSIISMLDINAVNYNYGKINNIYPQTVASQQNPLLFIPQSSSPQPGDTILIDVWMGTEANPAHDYSGISFDVLYNPEIFDTAWIEFNNHSWLGYDSPVLKYAKNAYDGKVDVAFTRGDESTKSGFGIIGTVHIIIDDVQGIRIDDGETVEINFNSSYGLNNAGHLTKMNDEVVGLQIDLSQWDEELKKNVLSVYPNPSSDFVDLFLIGDNIIEEVRVFNMMGQEMQYLKGINENETRLDVSRLQTGMYILDVKTDKSLLTRKLEVVRY